MGPPLGRRREAERCIARVVVGQSVLLSGELGIGKTALLGHVVDQLRETQVIVTTLHANAGASNIPFGALTGFIDPTDDVDPVLQLAAATRRLRRAAGDTPLVLHIDDAQYLDSASTAVLLDLVTSVAATIVASVRSTDPTSNELDELWRQAEIERIELPPLSPAVMADLAAGTLGDDATDEAIAFVVDRAGGNPLFGSELAKAQVDGVPAGLSPQLLDLVEHRLAALDRRQQQHLTMVAVGQPLDSSLEIVDESVLVELESMGLVSTTAENGLVTVTLRHPLYGEAIRQRQTPLQRRVVSRRLANALMSHPAQRRGEALRIVNWLIEAGDRPPPDLAEAAAFEAVGWLDTELAEKLARMAVEDDRSPSTLFALGDVLRLSRRPGDAASIWTEAFEVAGNDDDIRKIALALGQLYILFLGQPDSAIEVLENALHRIKDPAMRLGIESDLALERASLDRRESAAEIDRILDDPNCGDESAWTALSNILWAKSTSLDVHGVERYLTRATEIEQRLPPDRDGEIDLIRAIAINVEMIRGDLDAATNLAETWHAEAAGRGIPTGLCRFSTALVELMQGETERADASVTSSLAQLRAFDSFNVTPIVLCAGAITAVANGDTELATARLRTAAKRGGANAPWLDIWLPRAAAWVAALAGDARDACRRAIEAGKFAYESDDVGWGAFALHDAVAWGNADQAIDLLVRRGYESDCGLFDIMFDHAAAAAERSPGGLANCARRFEQAGAYWLAGTAWANRAALDYDEVETCRDATRALCLTPPVGLLAGTADRALTRRQLDVARLASTGAASKAIAADLFLSGRTVDNHLRETYRRLGISGRRELSEVVERVPDVPSSD